MGQLAHPVAQTEAVKRLNIGDGATPRRLITDTEAVLHPGEIQRPFKTDKSEPPWLRHTAFGRGC